MYSKLIGETHCALSKGSFQISPLYTAEVMGVEACD